MMNLKEKSANRSKLKFVWHDESVFPDDNILILKAAVLLTRGLNNVDVYIGTIKFFFLFLLSQLFMK